MRAAIFEGPGAVEVGERPDPVIQEPTNAVVRVVLSCVCGSDLWYYRGESPHAAGSIGHEFIGIVEQAGAGVRNVRPGDLVIAPFIYSDMSCPHCLNGSTISCVAGGNFGDGQIDGTISPGRVFDFETDLDHIAEAYQAMDQRRAAPSCAGFPNQTSPWPGLCCAHGCVRSRKCGSAAMSLASLTAAATTSNFSRIASTSSRGRCLIQPMTISCSSALLVIRAVLVAYLGSVFRSGRPMASKSRMAMVWLDAAIASQPRQPPRRSLAERPPPKNCRDAG